MATMAVYVFTQQQTQTILQQRVQILSGPLSDVHQSFIPSKPKGSMRGQHSAAGVQQDTHSKEIILQQQSSQSLSHFNKTNILDTISKLKERVRKLRSSKKVLMPVDLGAIALTTALQNATRCYLMHTLAEYFPTSPQKSSPGTTSSLLSSNQPQQRLNLAIQLKFPLHMIAADIWLHSITEGSGVITLYVELVPPLLLPHAFFTIIQIAQTFKSGYFHRNAGHVLQSNIQAKYHGGVVFMEYHRSYPHEKFTLGFA